MTVTAAPPAMLAFDVVVAAVTRLSPSMARVTFGGDCLACFGDGGALGPRDLRVKLMLPAHGQPLPDLSDLSVGWYQRWLALDERVRGSMRTYTVRRARVSGARPEIDIDFVLHGEGPQSGPGSGWAAQARPGQRLTIIGPCARSQAYGGIEWRPPASAAGTAVRVLLAGDETAVPAIGSILESLPEGYAGHALLEVPSAGDVLDVAGTAATGAVQVRWLPRHGRPRGELLREAVLTAMAERVGRASSRVSQVLPDIDVDAEILWETTESALSEVGGRPAPTATDGCYAWVAGEASVVRELRRLLVRDLGLDRRQVAFMGYWREGRAERL
jgi:NADPH-dependent ferric siderophore reductase